MTLPIVAGAGMRSMIADRVALCFRPDGCALPVAGCQRVLDGVSPGCGRVAGSAAGPAGCAWGRDRCLRLWLAGDCSLAASDIDVIVLVRSEPGEAMTRELAQLHAALAGSGGPAGQLHCLYVAADAVSDPERLCTYWFGGCRTARPARRDGIP